MAIRIASGSFQADYIDKSISRLDAHDAALKAKPVGRGGRLGQYRKDSGIYYRLSPLEVVAPIYLSLDNQSQRDDDVLSYTGLQVDRSSSEAPSWLILCARPSSRSWLSEQVRIPTFDPETLTPYRNLRDHCCSTLPRSSLRLPPDDPRKGLLCRRCL